MPLSTEEVAEAEFFSFASCDSDKGVRGMIEEDADASSRDVKPLRAFMMKTRSPA